MPGTDAVEYDDDFTPLDAEGEPVYERTVCQATRRDGTKCQGYGVVDINSGHYCQAHGWDLLKRKRRAQARDRAAIEAQFKQIGGTDVGRS